jgi:hypothetical protein
MIKEIKTKEGGTTNQLPRSKLRGMSLLEFLIP